MLQSEQIIRKLNLPVMLRFLDFIGTTYLDDLMTVMSEYTKFVWLKMGLFSECFFHDGTESMTIEKFNAEMIKAINSCYSYYHEGIGSCFGGRRIDSLLRISSYYAVPEKALPFSIEIELLAGLLNEQISILHSEKQFTSPELYVRLLELVLEEARLIEPEGLNNVKMSIDLPVYNMSFTDKAANMRVERLKLEGMKKEFEQRISSKLIKSSSKLVIRK